MKTAELTGIALDWAVATCEGINVVSVKHGRATFTDPADDGALNDMPINYSTDWAQGGPIIERENICLWTEGYDWEAKQYGVCEQWGETPLIAAMRCYVASKLGDDIEIPEELK